MSNVPFTLIIYGPTGVGKSDLAEQIATHTPAEIVNIDLGQLYTPLSIGTAKPSWKESPISHHLFDILDEPLHYSVVAYRTRVVATLHDIWQRGKTPILVGGSSFYLKSLFFPPNTPQLQEDVFRTIKNDHTAWEELYLIDPQRASSIDKNDHFRIARALAIWRHTGKKPSDFIADFNPPSDFLLLFLTRDREELYTRINQRVDSMIQQGWLDEVRSLINTPWEDFLREKKIIGYNELLDFLKQESDHSLDGVLDIVAQRTRNYAKRQHTFWRSLKKQLESAIKLSGSPAMVEEVNLTSINSDLYIKHLLKRVVDKVK